jgi:uncharacterized membrane protein YeaQ/YmgE (transglycosylase-associated protein family)
MDGLAWFVVIVAVCWVIPVLVAEDIAVEKDREGWIYALLLGWIGVIVVALLPPRKEELGSGISPNRFPPHRLGRRQRSRGGSLRPAH